MVIRWKFVGFLGWLFLKKNKIFWGCLMAYPRLFKVGVRYKSTSKGIEGLTLGSYWFAPNTHCVVENVPGYINSFGNNRKIVKKGTLTECRNYMKERFGRK